VGETLGGFRGGGYPKYMESDDYQAGITKLLELAEQGNIVLMCKERSDLGCHRRCIIEKLVNKDVKTIPL
jgi:uncharacterized protein (DUF488 family)